MSAPRYGKMSLLICKTEGFSDVRLKLRSDFEAAILDPRALLICETEGFSVFFEKCFAKRFEPRCAKSALALVRFYDFHENEPGSWLGLSC